MAAPCGLGAALALDSANLANAIEMLPAVPRARKENSAGKLPIGLGS
jgi:hypothetical protein